VRAVAITEDGWLAVNKRKLFAIKLHCIIEWKYRSFVLTLRETPEEGLTRITDSEGTSMLKEGSIPEEYWFEQQCHFMIWVEKLIWMMR